MEETPVPHVDLERPNAARVYDYWLGGSANFAVDRELGDHMARLEPGIVTMARTNRAFLTRLVRYLAASGVHQFLDLGAGVPTKGNVHEIADSVRPGCRVAYVDNEPVAVAYNRELIAGREYTTVTDVDMTDPTSVLAAPGVAGLLDFDAPIAVLGLMILHYFPDDATARTMLDGYRSALASGSYLALSHPSDDDPALAIGTAAQATSDSDHPAHLRDREGFRALLGGGELVEPGLTWVNEWRPDDATPSGSCGVYGAVVRLP